MSLNFKVATCSECGQSVNVTHFISALNTHNVILAADVAFKLLERKRLTDEEDEQIARTFTKHVVERLKLPATKCYLCRQTLPAYR